ncbi:MAG: hypothetical protein KDC26_02100 [Armatimonadetes bacterium]|nr:hypothetical protein [Armatimonadota bacterium]
MPVLSSIVALAILGAPTQEIKLKPYRMEPSGLVLRLPSEPKKSTPANDGTTSYTLTQDGFQLSVHVQRASELLNPGKSYLAKIEPLRATWGKKITGILNEVEISAARRFGSERSIGFLLEIDDKSTSALVWHKIEIDGFIVELEAQSDRKHQPLLENVADTQRYVSPETGEYKLLPVASTPLSTPAGLGFFEALAPNGDPTGTLLLTGSNIPCIATIEPLKPEDIKLDDPEAMLARVRQQIESSMQGIRSDIKIKKSERGGIPIFEMSGTVIIQGKLIRTDGVLFADMEKPYSLVVVYDTDDPDAQPFAKALLEKSSYQKSGSELK